MSDRIDETPGKVSRFFFRAPIYVYRAGLGWLMSKRLLMLIHMGRKSGAPRFAVLEVVRWDEEEGVFVVPAAWGEKADWYRNLIETPEAKVNHRGRTVDVVATRLPLDEAAVHFEIYAKAHPRAAANIGKYMGVSFDDSSALAARIPLVELRPR